MKRITKKSSFKLLLLLVVLVTAFSLVTGMLQLTNNKTVRPSPRQGILDLSNWNPTRNALFNLNGVWEFYWQKLLSYSELRDKDLKPDLMAEVPNVWNSYKINGESLPGFGYATYRLKVRNAQDGQALAIRMPAISAAYNLYINEKLVASIGNVDTDKDNFKPEYRPVLVEFTPPSDDFDIIIQAANFSYARGGLWNPIFMGSSENMV
jgi:hypothetical protein